MLHGGCFAGPECHVGILGLKGRDALGHDVVAAQVAAADGDNAALQGAQLVRHVVEMVFQLVNLLDSPDELDPERGQGDGPGLPLKDGRTGLLLLLADHRAQRGLGDVQLFGRLAEAALLVNAINILHIPEHRCISSMHSY